MFGFRRSIGYFDHCSHFDDGWGPNRSNWNDKSDAALRREQQADNLFEAFLKKCSSYDVNDKSIFPVTEEVVDASIHLTGACYTSFRKRVIAKGCKLKRREATPAERQASGDKRKGKLYVISITCTVHPTKAADAKAKTELAAAARKKKAAEAVERKAEKERKEREERERMAEMQRAKVRERYESIVGGGKDELKHKHTTTSSATKKGTTKTTGTMDTFVNVKVTSEALLKHAESVYAKRTSDVRSDTRKEEQELMELRKKHAKEESELRSSMRKKETELIESTKAEYGEIKSKIEEECNNKNVIEEVPMQ